MGFFSKFHAGNKKFFYKVNIKENTAVYHTLFKVWANLLSLISCRIKIIEESLKARKAGK